MTVRRRDGWLSGILKIWMTGIGMVLLALLGVKAVGQANWAGMKNLALESVKSQMAIGLDLLWRQSYPTAGDAFEAYEKELESGSNPYLDVVFNGIPLYRFAESGGGERDTYGETDPSYRDYQKNQQFYAEHDYLFRYGNEESNQGPSDDLEESPKEPEKALADSGQDQTIVTAEASAQGVHTVKANLPVIGKEYLMAQLADYDFLMKNFYSIHTSTTADRTLMNAEKFLDKDFALEPSDGKPQILIYHTHSQETYADYGPDHPEATVVGMGSYLTELLTAKGYGVIHDTSVYDLQGEKLDRNKAYTYALEGITKILQENPSVEVVLDLHRDGVKEGLHLMKEVNGKPTASIMFFNGVSQTPQGPIEYLPNPYREDNLAFSLQMQLDAAAYYPGLTRKIYIKGLRYNLHLRPRSALIEVGAQTNTYEEALNAMEPLSELLDMVLQGN